MTKTLNFLLAEDDDDDRIFFDSTLTALSVSHHLDVVHDGEKLMDYLVTNTKNPPDLIFLDLNMPRKNGFECLREIKDNRQLRNIPIIIYSTAMNDKTADLLYSSGAHYYFQKTNLKNLQNNLDHIVSLIKNNEFERPARNEFILRGNLV